MPSKSCSVLNCTFYNSAKTSNFSFPKSREACEKWVDFTNNPKIMALFIEKGHISRTHTICSWHFRRSQMKNPDCPSKGLKIGQEPTLRHPDDIYSEHVRKMDENYKPDNSEINCMEDSKVGHSDGIIIEYPENTIEYQENQNKSPLTYQNEYQLLDAEKNLVYDDIFTNNFLIITSTQDFSQPGLTNEFIINDNVNIASPKTVTVPKILNGLSKNNFVKTEIKINEVPHTVNIPCVQIEKKMGKTVNRIREEANQISSANIANSSTPKKAMSAINKEHIYTKPDTKEYIIKRIDNIIDDLQSKEKEPTPIRQSERLTKAENETASNGSDESNGYEKRELGNLDDDESINETDSSEESLISNASKLDRRTENFLIINALSKNSSYDYSTIKRQCKFVGGDENVKYTDVVTKTVKKNRLSKLRKLKIENKFLKKRVAFLQKKIKDQAWELKILRSEIMFGAGVAKF